MSAFLALASCAGASDTADTTTVDSSAIVTEAPAPVTPAVDSAPVAVTAPPEKTPEEKKEGKEIKHGSDNDRVLDSIKKAKGKDKTPPREIRHGSANDQLLHNIKQAKRKRK